MSPCLATCFIGFPSSSAVCLVFGWQVQFKESSLLASVFIVTLLHFLLGLNRQSYALLKEEGLEIDIDFYITSVKALLKLIQVILFSVVLVASSSSSWTLQHVLQAIWGWTYIRSMATLLSLPATCQPVCSSIICVLHMHFNQHLKLHFGNIHYFHSDLSSW